MGEVEEGGVADEWFISSLSDWVGAFVWWFGGFAEGLNEVMPYVRCVVLPWAVAFVILSLVLYCEKGQWTKGRGSDQSNCWISCITFSYHSFYVPNGVLIMNRYKISRHSKILSCSEYQWKISQVKLIRHRRSIKADTFNDGGGHIYLKQKQCFSHYKNCIHCLFYIETTKKQLSEDEIGS